LLNDGRKSFTQIASECGETKATVCNRFNVMKKAGIVTGATIQLDYATFGYNTVGSIIFKVNPENIDYVVNQVTKIPNIFNPIKLNNNSTVYVVATLKTMDELNKAKEAIKKLPTVSELITNVWLGVRNIPENLQITANSEAVNEKTNYHLKKSSGNAIDVDETDRQIIQRLAKDGRMPFADIAEELGIATSTAIRKYERLKQNGVINVSIQVNPLKLGYRGMAIFNLAFLTQSSLSSIVDKLAKIPDITLILKTSGQFELSICSVVKDIDQLIALQTEIAKIAEVSKMVMILEKALPVLPAYMEYISTF
jgi:DNA-binding Lrp family transcriptional regulator